MSFWVGTQAEYDSITDKDESRLYLISDDPDLETVLELMNTDIEQLQKDQHSFASDVVTALGDLDSSVRKNADDIVSLGNAVSEVSEESAEGLRYHSMYTRILDSNNKRAYGESLTITDKTLIDALRNCKTALVRVAAQSVLCSVAQAGSYQTANDDMWYISGCAPYTRIISQQLGYIDLVVVTLAIHFDDINNPTTATITNLSQVQNIAGGTGAGGVSGGNVVGQDTSVIGANVYNILLLNSSNFFYQ